MKIDMYGLSDGRTVSSILRETRALGLSSLIRLNSLRAKVAGRMPSARAECGLAVTLLHGHNFGTHVNPWKLNLVLSNLKMNGHSLQLMVPDGCLNFEKLVDH